MNLIADTNDDVIGERETEEDCLDGVKSGFFAREHAEQQVDLRLRRDPRDGAHAAGGFAESRTSAGLTLGGGSDVPPELPALLSSENVRPARAK